MSDYGEVKIPIKDWKFFRDRIYNRYNEKLSYLYQRESFLGNMLLSKLKRVKYTSKTGGYF